MRPAGRWLATLAVLVGCGCAGRDGPLPRGATLGGYSDRGEAESYAAATLFMYMDGGAEIFREYGCLRAWIRPYAQGSRSYTAEVFELRGAAEASALYSHLRRPGTEQEIATGCPGSLSDGEARLAKGRYALVCRSDDLVAPDTAGAGDLCARLAGRLSGECGVGNLFDDLPAEGRMRGTEVAILGRLGLNSRSWLISLSRAGFERGELASYGLRGGKAELFRGRYADADAARLSCAESETVRPAGVLARCRGRRVVLVRAGGALDPAAEDLIDAALAAP